MAQAARHIPEDHQPLCEGCGYILEGLPADSRCPECGKPVAESIDPAGRVVPLWEQKPGPVTFIATSVHVLFRPSHFYRHLQTRRKSMASTAFAILWTGVCSLLLALTALGHAQWLESRSGFGMPVVPRWTVTLYAILKVFVVPAILITLLVITHVAARLTAWEAAYRGLRLPLPVVQRGLDYHSVHLLPVCLLALITVHGYQVLLQNRVLTRSADVGYVWALCAEVIICAGYLFFTYWAAMRNMLFANR